MLQIDHLLDRKPVNQFVAKFIGTPTMNLLKGEIVEENDRLFLQAGPLKIRFPAKTAAAPKQKHFKQITIGIRPERPMIKDEDQKDLCLPVSVIENIGPEFLVYTFHPQGQIVVRTSEEPTGDSLNLALDPRLKSNAFALERICA